jgi:hypothetical protein
MIFYDLHDVQRLMLTAYVRGVMFFLTMPYRLELERRQNRACEAASPSACDFRREDARWLR